MSLYVKYFLTAFPLRVGTPIEISLPLSLFTHFDWKHIFNKNWSNLFTVYRWKYFNKKFIHYSYSKYVKYKRQSFLT